MEAVCSALLLGALARNAVSVPPIPLHEVILGGMGSLAQCRLRIPYVLKLPLLHL